ncbi:hypothetical protein QBC35DRAFT_76972 [Podospora australis]|uniref:Infection structure specific protein n=1 Tax=Podospora australis TaxID=1536484 RepID=A0AAN6WLT4_9PEZI|nr:hypothetical protein QBC35DRAFT_76972 [Podospora australis]
MNFQSIIVMLAGSGLAVAHMHPDMILHARQDSDDATSTTSTTTRSATDTTLITATPSVTRAACVTKISSLLVSNTASPTIASEFGTVLASIQSSLHTAGTPEQRTRDPSVICQVYASFTNMPVSDGPIKTAYNSYISAYLSYASAFAPTLSSLAKECMPTSVTRRLDDDSRPDEFWAGRALLDAATDVSQCITAVEVQFGLRTAFGVEATGTSGGAGSQGAGTSAGSTSSSTGGAAGPRETGYVAAFAAFAAAGVVGAMGVL